MGCNGSSSVAAARQLHHAVAAADLLAQNAAEIAFARFENVLPDADRTREMSAYLQLTGAGSLAPD